MKKNDIKGLREKSLPELEKLVSEKKLEISQLLAKIASGGEKNLKKIKNLKTEVARILTIIREKEIIEKEKPDKEEKK